ncbi:C39 family peptidase [Effusibacillus pohliae]|uniref:C39 family peptidase n=1 Tax=Effusibacillus pohliae TaxID=232270 RepID=UPI00037FCD1F|nr:C39 family peptidase [Effusibacillus pohliae]
MGNRKILGGVLTIQLAALFAGTVQAAEPGYSMYYQEASIDEATKAVLLEKERLVEMYVEAKQGKRSMEEVEKAVQNFEKKHKIDPKRPLATSKFSSHPSKPDDPKTVQTGTSPGSVSAQRTPNYSSNYVYDLYQETQWNGYYCGPATAAMIIKSKQVSTSQSETASLLGTESYKETPWSVGPSTSPSYPMRDALNYKLNTSWYVPYGLPESVTTTTFKDHITFDVDFDYGVAGDAYEVPNGPHLVGHPVSQTIYHWFAIDGYSNNGDSTHYADPASGCSALSWGNNVPKYSTMSTSTVATIVNGRGIIW